MSELYKKILQESQAFRAMLPELLPLYKSRWVVFRDGRVQSDHDTEEEAFLTGIARFGKEGGQVITQVVEVQPSPLSAGVLFGLSP